jgi:hypothetical protein
MVQSLRVRMLWPHLRGLPTCGTCVIASSVFRHAGRPIRFRRTPCRKSFRSVPKSRPCLCRPRTAQSFDGNVRTPVRRSSPSVIPQEDSCGADGDKGMPLPILPL